MLNITVNYWAVLAAAVLNMALGALWFGPLFSKAWMREGGFTQGTMDEAMKKGIAKSYALMAVGSLVMACTLAHAIVLWNTYAQSAGVVPGLMTAFWVWLGFVMPVTIGVVLWEGKSWMYWLITYGYYLVGMLLMGALLGAWN